MNEKRKFFFWVNRNMMKGCKGEKVEMDFILEYSINKLVLVFLNEIYF